MLPNERASMAVSALKDMGICEKRVKPVLISLLRLYDKNWELIEDENYRVLIDAIFELEGEQEETSKKNKETPSSDESTGPPLKRMRLRNQADHASNSGETSIRPKVEEDDVPIGRRTRSAERESIPHQHDKDEKEIHASSLALTTLDSEEPSQLYLRDRAERNTVSPQSRSKEKGKEPISSSQIHCREEVAQCQPHLEDTVVESDSVLSRKAGSLQMTYREKRALCTKGDLPVTSSLGVLFKETKVEPGISILPKDKLTNSGQNLGLIMPKSEPTDDYLPLEESADDYTAFEIPIAIMVPQNPERTISDDPLHKDGCSNVNGSSGEMNGAESLASKDRHNDTSDRACKATTSSELVNVPGTPTSFEIASSPLGEVKIYLNCNQSLDRPDFHIPSLDAVLKAVEDKCLRSYRILEPNFSMMKLMQEVCQSFWDLSNNSSDPKEDSFVHFAPGFNFLNKPNLQNAFGAKGDQQGNVQIPTSLSKGSPNLQSSAEDSHHNHKADDNDSNSSNSRSLIVVPEQELTIDAVRTLHDVNDISKGEERVKISLINEVSSDPYPPTFYYIPRNIVYQSAYVNFSLARIGDEDCCSNCFGDCLSSSIPCACARETGGEFAYTLEGLVKEKLLDECISMNRDPQQHRHYYCKECPLERSKEGGLSDPCKGHLVRKFIKECWSKCGCNKQCGNRVVQRGISCNLQVFLTSEGKGWGLRTLEDLPRGTFVCEYVGEVLTNTELYERNLRSTGDEKHTYPVLLDADWGSEGVLKDEEALCLDATYYGNVARFINHRCFDANLVEIPVEVETPDHHYYHLAFFTTREVDALEELTWDYGIDFNDHNHPVKAFGCSCRSKCCRDMKRSHKTKSRR